MTKKLELKINGRVLGDDESITPFELSQLVGARIETIYRWINHPTMPLPAAKEGLMDFRYTIKVKDIREYFKLREETE